MPESISNSIFAITSATSTAKSGGGRAEREPFCQQLGRAQSANEARSDSDSDVKRTRRTEERDSVASPEPEPKQSERLEIATEPSNPNDRGEKQEDTSSLDSDEPVVVVEIAAATSEVPLPLGVSGEIVVDATEPVESTFDTNEGALTGKEMEELGGTSEAVTTEEFEESSTQLGPVESTPNDRQESIESGREPSIVPDGEKIDQPQRVEDALPEQDAGDNERTPHEQPLAAPSGEATNTRRARATDTKSDQLTKSDQPSIEAVARPNESKPAAISTAKLDELDPIEPNTETKSAESNPKTDAVKTGPAAETSSLTDRAGRLLRGVSESTEAESSRGVRTDAARFVSRVSKAFGAAQENGGTIRLRLSPPELGALRIELSVQQGALSARMETETPAARAILLDNLPALRERLAEQQIRVDQFHVDVGGGQHDGAPDWEAAREEASQRTNKLANDNKLHEIPSEESTPIRAILTDDGRFNAVA